MRDIRLYLEALFTADEAILLTKNQLHYLVNVMRVEPGTEIKVFNGINGEWLGAVSLESKKKGFIELKTNLKPQSDLREIHLHFSPLKNTPTSFLIEKATELGATHFHPVLCERSIVRHFKSDKQRLTAIEAAEQCERLSVPGFQDLCSLGHSLKTIPQNHLIITGDERRIAQTMNEIKPLNLAPLHIFIGPEGGFTPLEFKRFQENPNVTLVKLSDHILRAETAAICALSQL